MENLHDNTFQSFNFTNNKVKTENFNLISFLSIAFAFYQNQILAPDWRIDLNINFAFVAGAFSILIRGERISSDFF